MTEMADDDGQEEVLDAARSLGKLPGKEVRVREGKNRIYRLAAPAEKAHLPSATEENGGRRERASEARRSLR